MGWDTTVIILAERLSSKEMAKELTEVIHEKDAKFYWNREHSVWKTYTEVGFALFYSYERRKVAPGWIIEEISEIFENVEFTILASCPEFICGPAGLIRIRNREIVDSYGIMSEQTIDYRYEIILNPSKYRNILVNWYRKGGKEEQLRDRFIDNYPLDWCNRNYVDKLVPIHRYEDLKSLRNDMEPVKYIVS